MKKQYPIFLNLDGRKCVVVGGGKVAERKVLSLIPTGAIISVISPTITKGLKKEEKKGRIKHIKRCYKKGDIKGSILVIAGTANRELNRRVAEEARSRKIFVNVVDDPVSCDFFLPAVVTKGRVIIAVSTGGASPALARRIKEDIQVEFGKEYGDLAEILENVRAKIKEKFARGEDRRKLFLLLTSSRVLKILKTNGQKSAEKEIQTIITSYPPTLPSPSRGED